MRYLLAVIVFDFAMWTVPAGAVETTGAKDELLSLLDEAVATVSEPNRLQDTLPSLQSDSASEPNEPAAAPETSPTTMAEPNNLPNVPEPNAPALQNAGTDTGRNLAETAESESRRLRHAFLMGRLEPVETLSARQQELNLNELIQQVQGLQAPKTLVAQAGPNASQSQNGEAPPAAISEQASDEQVNRPAQSELHPQPDPNTAAVEMLEQAEKSASVVNPLLLADALFRQGHEQQAFVYYQKAAEQWAGEEGETLQWALFQMANCCVTTDPAKAKDLYSELLSRFPNCRWNSSAQSRRATLEWTMSESVQQYTRTGEHAQR